MMGQNHAQSQRLNITWTAFFFWGLNWFDPNHHGIVLLFLNTPYLSLERLSPTGIGPRFISKPRSMGTKGRFENTDLSTLVICLK